MEFEDTITFVNIESINPVRIFIGGSCKAGDLKNKKMYLECE